MASELISDRQLTKQSLPDDRYLFLLGIAMSAFASNNGFIIENIIRTKPDESWHDLIDIESGKVSKKLAETFDKNHLNIVNLFDELVKMRNRIIHGFRITSSNGEQILATKERKTQKQFYITEEYLETFIRKNDELSDFLYDYRKELRKE